MVLEAASLWLWDVGYVVEVWVCGSGKSVIVGGYVMEVWVCGSGSCVIVAVGCGVCGGGVGMWFWKKCYCGWVCDGGVLEGVSMWVKDVGCDGSVLEAVSLWVRDMWGM